MFERPEAGLYFHISATLFTRADNMAKRFEPAVFRY